MSTWPAVADLDDIAHMPLRPFNPDQFPIRQDPAIEGRPPLAALKSCCGEVLAGEDCDCAELLAQLEQANRHPILFTRRAA